MMFLLVVMVLKMFYACLFGGGQNKKGNNVHSKNLIKTVYAHVSGLLGSGG